MFPSIVLLSIDSYNGINKYYNKRKQLYAFFLRTYGRVLILIIQMGPVLGSPGEIESKND
jgi:hypothetical protein